MKALYQKQVTKCIITLCQGIGFFKDCYYINVKWNDATNAVTARMTRSFDDAFGFFNSLIEKYSK